MQQKFQNKYKTVSYVRKPRRLKANNDNEYSTLTAEVALLRCLNWVLVNKWLKLIYCVSTPGDKLLKAWISWRYQ